MGSFLSSSFICSVTASFAAAAYDCASSPGIAGLPSTNLWSVYTKSSVVIPPAYSI